LKVLLETERLVLRRFTAGDVQHLFDLDNDPEVMRFINGGVPTPRAVIENQILPVFLDHDERAPAYGFWAADEQSSGEFLGWFVFRPRGHDAFDVDIGYRLRSAAWGAGYATEGARALIDEGFTKYGVKRVTATTYSANQASRRVMEKLGMTFLRSFRITADDLSRSDTSYHAAEHAWDGDDVEYCLKKADWERMR
jgi:RimJ/RimL family protein N-acetyltransferase